MQIMMDVAASGSMLPFGDNVLTAILGYGVVFMGLMILMAIVYGMGAIFKAAANRRKPLPAAPAPKGSRLAPKAEPEGEPAPGTAGEVKLFDVPDKEAAMIMAIVASQTGKPLNELRFKSIKEVKEQ